MFNWVTENGLSNMQNTPAFIASICFSILIGTYCQAAETEAPPPPGKLYEVGGRKMHLYQSGKEQEGPSVVLEAGAGAFSLDWYLVQQEVQRFAVTTELGMPGANSGRTRAL